MSEEIRDNSYKKIAKSVSDLEEKYYPELKEKTAILDGEEVLNREKRYIDIYGNLYDHDLNMNYPDTHDDYIDAMKKVIDIEVKEIPELLKEKIIIDTKPYDYIEGRSIEILNEFLNHPLSVANGDKYSEYVNACSILVDPAGQVKRVTNSSGEIEYKGSDNIDEKTGKIKTDLIVHCTKKMPAGDSIC